MADDDDNKVSDTEEEHDNFIRYIIKKNLKWQCPICSCREFGYSPKSNPITFPRIDIEKNIVDLSQTIPAYWIYCKSCFNMTFFQIALIARFLNSENQEQK